MRAAARVTRQVLTLMTGGVVFVLVAALSTPGNPPMATLTFYVPILAVIGGITLVLRSGRVRAAAWAAAVLFWAIVTLGTFLFGGLYGHNAMAYIVCVMVAASTLGRRPALLFGLLSVASTTAIAVLQAYDLLPESVTPPGSVINAWISAVVSLGLATYLLYLSLTNLQEAVDASEQHAGELATTQATLLQAQKMDVVGRLISGIAHDFNNLLTVMMSVSELVRMRADLDPQDARLLDDLDTATQRASLLTGRLLAFGRPQELRARPIDLGALLRELLPLLQRLVGDGVHMEFEGAGEEMAVNADPIGVEQMVLNLVINSRDAMEGSGRIILACRRLADPPCIELSVTDNGPGIPAHLHDRVFEPFFTTKATGTGLGLATVRDLAKEFGATVSLRSAPGRGTAFAVRWAATEDDGYITAEPEASLPPADELRILLVEDNALVRRATAVGLRTQGWEVETANDGLEALSRLETDGAFDIVITDNAMLGTTGAELARLMREARPEMPILVVSGQRVEDLPDDVAFLLKPYDRQTLVNAVLDAYGNKVQS